VTGLHPQIGKREPVSPLSAKVRRKLRKKRSAGQNHALSLNNKKKGGTLNILSTGKRTEGANWNIGMRLVGREISIMRGEATWGPGKEVLS